MLHYSQVVIFFFYRATETNFYTILFCQRKTKQSSSLNEGRLSLTPEDNEQNLSKGFLDPEQPLTAMISKTLNFEFISCILSGLSMVFENYDRKLKKNAKNRESSSDSNLFERNKSNILDDLNTINYVISQSSDAKEIKEIKEIKEKTPIQK